MSTGVIIVSLGCKALLIKLPVLPNFSISFLGIIPSPPSTLATTAPSGFIIFIPPFACDGPFNIPPLAKEVAGILSHAPSAFSFSSVCDMGAYFVGVTCGKHKLCPNISPKKTVEGAVGGIISSMVVTVILALCFSKSLVLPIILTIPLCILGMIGDLFASAIKRSVDLNNLSDQIDIINADIKDIYKVVGTNCFDIVTDI